MLLGGSADGLGRGRELALYHVTGDPPQLVVQDAQPQYSVGRRLGRVALVGYDLESDTAEVGGRLSLRLYWRVLGAPLPLVATALGETLLETHQLGLGNLPRYVQEFDPPRDGVVVEHYAVVVPSLVEPGDYTLRVGLQDPFQPGGEPGVQSQALELTTIQVR